MNIQTFLRSSLLLFAFCLLSIQGQAQCYKVNSTGYFVKADTLYSFDMIGKDLYPALEKLRSGLGTPSSETSSRIKWNEIEHKGLNTKVSILLRGGTFTTKEKMAIRKAGKLPTKESSTYKGKPLAENQYQSLVIDIRHSNNKRIKSNEEQATIDWLNGILK